MQNLTFRGEYGQNAPSAHRYLHKVDLIKTLKKKFSAATRAVFAAFPNRHPIGAPAPDFELAALDGRAVSLAQFRGRKHVVLEFGSYS